METLEKAKHPIKAAALRAADLNARLLRALPGALDAELIVDDILSLALRAFDADEISEAEFCELMAKCLDTLTDLAR